MKKALVLMAAGTIFFMPVCQADLNGYQKTQLGLSALKTAIFLYTDTVNPTNVQQAKQAARLRSFARMLNGAAKGLDYATGIRNAISFGTHLNASCWQVAKDLEELKTLARLQEEHGEDIPVSALEKYYNGLKSSDEEYDEEIDELDFDAGEGRSLTTIMKPLLRIAELGLSIGLACQLGTARQRHLMMLGQAVCDGLLRFVCNKKGFISPSWLGKVEMASSLASCAYDAGNSGYNFLRPTSSGSGDDSSGPDSSGPDSSGPYVCPVCHGRFGVVQFGQMNGCKHGCCLQCANRNQRVVRVVGGDGDDDDAGALVGRTFGGAVDAGAVRCRCPICNRNGQRFIPQNLLNAQNGQPKEPKPNNGENKEEKCPICQDDLPGGNARQALPCMHMYCAACLRRAIAGGHLDRCYVCQHAIGCDFIQNLRQVLN